LTSALDGVEWLALSPGRFISSERALGTHWIVGWVVKRKILSPRQESNSRTLIVHMRINFTYIFKLFYARGIVSNPISDTRHKEDIVHSCFNPLNK
jgi:hypothetical protein